MRELFPNLIRLGNISSQVFKALEIRSFGSAVFLLCELPAMPASEALRDLWLAAPHGRLCPWQQARALALREASRELHKGHTQLEWIAARVEKVGGGSPGQDALHKFFKLVDADPDWFPGKQRAGKRGRQLS